MALLINIRRLEKEKITLEGELPVKALDLEGVDELIRVEEPLQYELEAEKLDIAILVQGSLALNLKCECVRCLKSFVYPLELTGWACHLPLEGDEKVTIVNDSVDLTPYLREDILLEFPQHPLCKSDCSGLSKKAVNKPKKTAGAGRTNKNSSAWAELNKIKF
jgi:uncharacterized protein